MEEYFTGGLFLGDINGITEGSFGIFGLFIYMGFNGNAFWVEQATDSLRWADVMAIVTCLGQVVLIFTNLKVTLDHQKKELKPGDLTGEPFVMSELILNILGYFLPLGLLTAVAHVGREPIVTYQTNGESEPLFWLIVL